MYYLNVGKVSVRCCYSIQELYSFKTGKLVFPLVEKSNI